jgi:hypothetical protein
MWFLRAFRRSDDELAGEAQLSSSAVLEVGTQAGVLPSPYLSTEIPADVAARVASTASVDLPLDEAEFVYMVEFDDDEPHAHDAPAHPGEELHADR